MSYYLQEHNNLVVNDSKKEEQESLVSQLLPYHVLVYFNYYFIFEKIRFLIN